MNRAVFSGVDIVTFITVRVNGCACDGADHLSVVGVHRIFLSVVLQQPLKSILKLKKMCGVWLCVCLCESVCYVLTSSEIAS